VKIIILRFMTAKLSKIDIQGFNNF